MNRFHSADRPRQDAYKLLIRWHGHYRVSIRLLQRMDAEEVEMHFQMICYACMGKRLEDAGGISGAMRFKIL
ncbi:hypothetical protein GF380_04715 [Candidatus Uhrbacteria bacterium]|nr:hypothetical protein [Candidatus Uhrbacteria bacterium]MBD3284356.1 hypothetical protein [Candidatus Uhrbacteria bacterium]